MNAPKATEIPHLLEKHNHQRIDNYYWLREREQQEVIDYLKAENAYTQAMMQHTEPGQEALFQEMKSRIKEDDASVPYRLGDFLYYTRFETGGEYPIYCRKRAAQKGGQEDVQEEVILNVNALAEGHAYFQVRGITVSTNHQLLAFSQDTVGRRIYTLKIKNLTSGELLRDEIPEVTGNVAWANDNRTLFYCRQDLQTLRSYRVYRHVLGTPPESDELIYEEADETFIVGVEKSKSKSYIFIASFSTLASEYRYLPADQPEAPLKVVLPREPEHEYELEHFGEHFYLRTNDRAQNFRLVKTPIGHHGRKHWEEVIPHREEVLLEGLEIFQRFLVLEERKMGMTHLRVMPWQDLQQDHYLHFEEAVYVTYLDYNPDFETDLLRFGYESLTTPSSTFDYHMETRSRELKKQKEVLGGFDPSNYVAERVVATAKDGTQVPISLVRRKDVAIDGQAPLLLYAYGSYGISTDPYFSSVRFSLIDRGIIYALAHVRGGSEMGRQWYESGKLKQKANTFSDFIACAEQLISEGYTQQDRLCAMGGSAGGMLMGVVINQRPDLFRAVVAAVPFVDVVTTMLDDSIPLTTGEYDEWGNPNQKDFYHYMLAYSPYDNVKAQDYPNLLVTSGLHDSQVQYWEPTKWVAKLRAMKTDDNRLLLHTNMEAGHGGASGRFLRLKETALEYAFLLDVLGLPLPKSTK